MPTNESKNGIDPGEGWRQYRNSLTMSRDFFAFRPPLSNAKSASQFAATCNRPQWWRAKGDDLLLSSDVLMDPNVVSRFSWLKRARPVLLPTVIMLRAMAIECYLKARFLREGGVLYGADGQMLKGKALKFRSLSNHNIAKLADEMGIAASLDNAECQLLKLLSEYAIIGRFPAHGDFEATLALKKRFPHWDGETETAFQRMLDKICYPRFDLTEFSEGELQRRSRGTDDEPAECNPWLEWNE